MSKNLELVRSIFDAWGRGDFTSTDWAHPEIEYTWTDGPHPSSVKGLNGMAETTRYFMSAWEDWRVEPGSYREVDGERGLALHTFHGLDRASRVALDVKGATAFRLRDGKVLSVALYFDRNRALTDLGLDA
jgi:ketosteroid isomerase-like protein